MDGYRRKTYFAIIFIALGIVQAATFGEGVRPIGVVFIAIGGLYFISGMVGRREANNKED